MKRLLVILAATVASFSCTFNISFGGTPIKGDGNIGEKAFELESFDAIRVAGALDVVYLQKEGAAGALLRTDENLLDEYKIEVEEGTLVISPRKGVSPLPTKGSQVTVTAPLVKSIKIAGSGDCNIPDGLDSPEDFTFSLAGSGDLYAYSINCKKLTAQVSGSGDLNAGSIVAESATIKVAGSGDIEVEALTSGDLTVGIAGSGSAEIGCRDAGNISADIAGSGRVTLKGTARTLSQHIAGSGEIITRGLSLEGE
ncbi:MAG: DUF2807 domain-containing protein [Bacteroidales bacterium]|nr:DUF2807 domain-containing protein [Bacteroidales bacterium]